MSPNQLLAPLEVFLAQSLHLLKLAEAGDWAGFEGLLSERQKGITTLSDNSLLIEVAKAGRADEMRELIQQISAANDQLSRIAETSRVELAEQLRLAVQAEKALDAYKG